MTLLVQHRDGTIRTIRAGRIELEDRYDKVLSIDPYSTYPEEISVEDIAKVEIILD